MNSLEERAISGGSAKCVDGRVLPERQPACQSARLGVSHLRGCTRQSHRQPAGKHAGTKRPPCGQQAPEVGVARPSLHAACRSMASSRPGPMLRASVRHTSVGQTDAHEALHCNPRFELARSGRQGSGAALPAIRRPTRVPSRRSCLFARHHQKHSTVFMVSAARSDGSIHVRKSLKKPNGRNIAIPNTVSSS
jgi:hypothetical protein